MSTTDLAQFVELYHQAVDAFVQGDPLELVSLPGPISSGGHTDRFERPRGCPAEYEPFRSASTKPLLEQVGPEYLGDGDIAIARP